jgi:hypothetical protein
MPLFALAFGNYTDGFLAADAMSEARAAAIKFVYLSVAVFGAFYLQAACWIRTGSRQASRMRMAFLKSVMRQDVQFFESQTSTGKATTVKRWRVFGSCCDVVQDTGLDMHWCIVCPAVATAAV